ncbi:sulfurtransferase [Microseira sp. BLCC-F43]|jgi:thiosulfate/3-mercaptopyruvate sulfurtransferase|uniref:sulfurtransferase n=1 Tax=Microseira sp. BLCC-F43 TaxID=3153602 RepID=UPI0035B9C4E1
MFQYAHPEVLVNTQWLEEHLDCANIRIVEVDISPDACKNAHIPGAVFWNIFTDLLLPDLRINCDRIAIEKLLSRSGITNETTVVPYGSYPATGGWVFWLLKLFGHDNVRVLNGGYQKWISEGRPVATDFSTFAPTQYSVKDIDASLRASHEEVRESIRPLQPTNSKTGETPIPQELLDKSITKGDSLMGKVRDRILLDVRAPQEYNGEWFFNQPPQGTERAGHIPGAVHIDHVLTLNENGTFKSRDELQTLFSSKGITPKKEVFPYCAIGGRSGYTWFVLKYLLGYPNVRNYDGSWNEWSRLSDVAIA